MAYQGAGQRGDLPSIPGSALVRGGVCPTGIAAPCPLPYIDPVCPSPTAQSGAQHHPCLAHAGLQQQLAVPTPNPAAPGSRQWWTSTGAVCSITLQSIPFLRALQEGAGCQHPAGWGPKQWLSAAGGGKGLGWERGVLWAPGPLSLGDCKIPTYIARLPWDWVLSSAIKEKDWPVPWHCGPSGRAAPKCSGLALCSIHVPWGRRGGLGPEPRAGSRQSAVGMGCSPSKPPCAVCDGQRGLRASTQGLP